MTRPNRTGLGRFFEPCSHVYQKSSHLRKKKTFINPDHRKWLQRDALIRHAILSSSTFAVQPSLNGAETAAQAWDKLKETYANRSRTWYLTHRDILSKTHKEGKKISEYMQSIKTFANDLALIGHHLNEDELIHHILRAGFKKSAEFGTIRPSHNRLVCHRVDTETRYDTLE